MEFSADTLRLNLIDLARTGSKLIQVAGRIDYTCPSGDPQDPVTFTTRDSHLVCICLYVQKKSIHALARQRRAAENDLMYTRAKEKLFQH